MDLATVGGLTAGLVVVFFEQGADVQVGQLLYVIDAEAFELTLQQSQADLISNEAQLAYARREFERNLPLVQTGAVSYTHLRAHET